MKKFFICCFLLFIFSIALFLPNLTLREVVSEDFAVYKTYSNTGDGVLASKIGILAFNSKFFEDENNVVIGEMVEIETSKSSLTKIIDKLGLLVSQKHNLNSCTVICGVSKLLPYKNLNENFNVQIKAYDDLIIIASPKFMN